MTARETYSSSIVTAETTKTNSIAVANAAHHATVDAVNSVVGYNHQTGNNVNLIAATVSANIAKFEALANAEKAKQAVVDKARDVLRATGDIGPM